MTYFMRITAARKAFKVNESIGNGILYSLLFFFFCHAKPNQISFYGISYYEQLKNFNEETK